MSLFKSREQRAKDRKKKELKKQISAIGAGGGRSNQATKKRLQRELADINKVVEKKTGSRVGGAQANKRKNYGNNQTGNGKGGGVTSKKTRSDKPKTKAQLMALKNIKKYGGTAKAAAANKAAMKLKIKKLYLDKKKKKK